MNGSLLQLKLKYAAKKYQFLVTETLKAYISKTPKRNILFSLKPEWEKPIKKGFVFTGHKLTFASFDKNKIADYDLIVPLTIEDVMLMHELGHNLNSNQIPIPSLECIQLCDDKFIFSKKMHSLGFGEYIPEIGDNLAYPFFLKKKIDTWGANTFLIENDAQFQAKLNSIEQDQFFCQTCVKGQVEYGTHILFMDNKIVFTLTIEKTFAGETSIHGKDPHIAGIVDCPFLALFADMLSALNYQGLCCLNFKIIDGKPYIFEINPRFGGSLSLYFFSVLRHLN
ncbi:MAG: hypothetical protein WC782_06930 [Methylococcaceae bacterium]|jgi:hypothetical protein